MQKSFYITTTLPYVNAIPHIGFASEIVRADIIARHKELMGHQIFFNTGTDEHGAKLYQAAREAGKDVQVYVNEYAEKFRELKVMLGLHKDIHFIRTTDPHHMKSAQEFWHRCQKNGYIYKKEYEAKYCVGCELEKTDSELENGHCPLHPTKNIEILKEENYFFAFSKFQKQLLTMYRSRPDFVRPDFRLREITLFVEHGLQDFSISRLKEKMPWGVPVPEDDNQVMYVWFDALVNYISTLGWPEDENTFNRFWRDGTPVQYAGKDNLRQQSALWQAMLMAAGLPTTHMVVIGGFVKGEGGLKMSKSLGNTIDPLAVVTEYGTDALRYFIARHIHPFEDTPVSLGHIREAYTADLVNGLGNLVARVMKLSEIHLELGVRSDSALLPKEYIDALEAFNIHAAIQYVERRIKALDKKITDTKPFLVVKENPKEGKRLIEEAVIELYTIARLLTPFLPETSKKIQTAVVENKMPLSLFPRKE